MVQNRPHKPRWNERELTLLKSNAPYTKTKIILAEEVSALGCTTRTPGAIQVRLHQLRGKESILVRYAPTRIFVPGFEMDEFVSVVKRKAIEAKHSTVGDILQDHLMISNFAKKWMRNENRIIKTLNDQADKINMKLIDFGDNIKSRVIDPLLLNLKASINSDHQDVVIEALCNKDNTIETIVDDNTGKIVIIITT